jgi:hypothetical protein
MTRAECIEAIRRYNDFEGLLTLWEEIRAGTVANSWDSGKALEYLILRAFELEGAEVVWSYEVRHGGRDALEQIDGVVYVDGLYVMVEVKDQAELVSYEPIAKLRAQIQRRPGLVIGVVLSRSGFTQPAKDLTRMSTPLSVLLWDGAELEEILRGVLSGGMRQALRLKLRHAVEQALPDFNTRMNPL